MKKKTLLFCFFVIMVLNANTQQGGFTGPGLQAVTVEQAKTFRDNTPVLLQGKIIQFMGDEKYLFEDNTGTITVEIDDRLWRGISIDENDMVEIVGEVDKSFRKIEIEVDSIRKL